MILLIKVYENLIHGLGYLPLSADKLHTLPLPGTKMFETLCISDNYLHKLRNMYL
jgi:hypothetical protein